MWSVYLVIGLKKTILFRSLNFLVYKPQELTQLLHEVAAESVAGAGIAQW